ncbi:hypothetical protein AAMO2058_001308500 [Amorphochlora amoebiformis]
MPRADTEATEGIGPIVWNPGTFPGIHRIESPLYLRISSVEGPPCLRRAWILETMTPLLLILTLPSLASARAPRVIHSDHASRVLAPVSTSRAGQLSQLRSLRPQARLHPGRRAFPVVRAESVRSLPAAPSLALQETSRSVANTKALSLRDGNQKIRSRARQAFAAVATLAVAGLMAIAPGSLISAHAAGDVVASSAAGMGGPLVSGGFVQALSLVFASEIGDKTFFIAALLAMRASRLLAFGGSMLALASMTIISVLIGQIFHNVPTSLTGGLPLDDYAAIAFLGYFGVKSILDAYNLPDNSAGVDEELEEAEKEISGTKADTQWQLLLEAFTLVFAAELGDRSFLATIALSAAQNPVMVGLGAILAHSLATGIAVASGSILAKYISEKVVGYVGGVLFIVFAITTAVGVF